MKLFNRIYIIVISIVLLALIVFVVKGVIIDNKGKDEKPKTSSKNENSRQINDGPVSLWDINNYIVDIWNNSFCDTKWYIECGTDSLGHEYSYEKAVNNAERIISKIDEYDSIMKSLNDSKYNNLKKIWEDEKVEIEKLYDVLKTNVPRANDTTYPFDYEHFQTLMYDFSDELYMLESY